MKVTVQPSRAFSFSAERSRGSLLPYSASRTRTRPCTVRLLSSAPPPGTEKVSASSEPLPPPIRGQPIKKGKVELRPAPVKPKASEVFPKSASPHKDQALKASSAAPSLDAHITASTTNEWKPPVHREGVIESARHDFESASSHGILAPAPPGIGKIRTLIHQAKEFFVRPRVLSN